MKPEDYACWPKGLPRHLTVPRTTLWHNLEVAATRYPDKPIAILYDSPLTYGEFLRQARALAGFLQQLGGPPRCSRAFVVNRISDQG